MKSIRVHQFGDPTVMKLEDVPNPTVGPGQVLVKIKAAGVNPVDAYIRAGKYAVLPPLPYTPGADGAGVVEAVGPPSPLSPPGDDLHDFAAGDLVYIGGAGAGPPFGF